MAVGQPSDIEKMFYMDAREKKRTGRGAYSKKGKGVKHGITGGVRFTYDNLKGKAKREYTKPGKVVSYNMNAIFHKDEFFKKTEKEQREYLQYWRSKYSNKEIMAVMEITKGDYFKLVKEFDLKSNRGPLQHVEKTRISNEDIERYKKDFIEYELFKRLESDQQHAIFDVYDNQFGTRELAEMWGVNDSNIYQIRSKLKNWVKKQKKKDEPQTIDLIQSETDGTGAILDVNEKEEQIHPEPPKEPQTENTDDLEQAKKQHGDIVKKFRMAQIQKPDPKPEKKQNGLTFLLDGDFAGELLERRLNKLLALVDGETSKFRVKIELEELEISEPLDKPEPVTDNEQDKELDTKEFLKTLTKLLI